MEIRKVNSTNDKVDLIESVYGVKTTPEVADFIFEAFKRYQIEENKVFNKDYLKDIWKGLPNIYYLNNKGELERTDKTSDHFDEIKIFVKEKQKIGNIYLPIYSYPKKYTESKDISFDLYNDFIVDKLHLRNNKIAPRNLDSYTDLSNVERDTARDFISKVLYKGIEPIKYYGGISENIVFPSKYHCGVYYKSVYRNGYDRSFAKCCQLINFTDRMGRHIYGLFLNCNDPGDSTIMDGLLCLYAGNSDKPFFDGYCMIDNLSRIVSLIDRNIPFEKGRPHIGYREENLVLRNNEEGIISCFNTQDCGLFGHMHADDALFSNISSILFPFIHVNDPEIEYKGCCSKLIKDTLKFACNGQIPFGIHQNILFKDKYHKLDFVDVSVSNELNLVGYYGGVYRYHGENGMVCKVDGRACFQNSDSIKDSIMKNNISNEKQGFFIINGKEYSVAEDTERCLDILPYGGGIWVKDPDGSRAYIVYSIEKQGLVVAKPYEEVKREAALKAVAENKKKLSEGVGQKQTKSVKKGK